MGAGAGSVAPDGAPREPVDESEFEVLKAWRMARAEGKPAYTVATNASLEEVLRQRPGSPEELLRIHGIGPAFCEKHGESLLVVLGELPGSTQPATAALP